MDSRRVRPGRWRLPLLGVLLGVMCAMAIATPAQAHATLESSTPEADAVIDSAPSDVAITFSEPVSVVAADTVVVDPDGKRASTEVTGDGDTVRFELRDGLPDGTYLVTYRVVSADGHPIPGGYTFSVGAPTEAPTAEVAQPGDTLVSALVLVNRYLGYLGLLAAAGTALLLLTGNADRGRGTTRLLVAGLSTVAATAIAGLYLHVPFTTGGTLWSITGPDVGAALASRFGGAAMVRLLLVLVAVTLLRLALSRVSRPLWWALGITGTLLAATWPMGGHATTSPAPALTVISDTVHVGAMALWGGGLLVLLFHTLRRADTARAAAFLPVWSRWATWLVAALGVAGVSQALIQIGTPSNLVSTRYGLLVLAKIVLFAVVLGIAAVARRRVAASGADVVARTRRLVGVELVVVVVILAVSAVLVQQVPGTAEAQTDAEQSTVVSETEETSDFTLRFELDPATVGTNSVHLYVYEPDGVTPLEPEEWEATYAGKDLAPVDIDLQRLAPNHASADISVPRAGEWEFVFKIRTSKFDRETVETTVSVK